MIEIKNIYTKSFENKTRLYCELLLDNKEKQIWFEVDNEYTKYLCYERCDAFVIGLLNYAMKHNLDIKSEVPITEDLLYNINTYLLPSLCKYDPKCYFVRIIAPIGKSLDNEGKIGTGLSCGVDSFQTIKEHINLEYDDFRITHFCINSVGSFADCYNNPDNVQNECFEHAKMVAKELNVPLIATNSNFAQEFPQDHGLSHTYSSMFAVFCLQKLWGKYYYSSGVDFGCFNLNDNTKKDPTYYDLLLVKTFSKQNLQIFSSGGALDRLEKVEQIADYEIAQKNLHVCVSESYNCNKCSKCRRTIMELVAINKLENFKEVFDIEYYKKHKIEYEMWLYQRHLLKENINEPTYQKLKSKINLLVKCIAIVIGAYKIIRKKIYH